MSPRIDPERARARMERVGRKLKRLEKVLVAYSGGVDSSLLLKIALDTLGPENVLAVTAVSPTFPERERREAVALARKLGARHRLVRTGEWKNPSFVSNPPDRCFHCKRILLAWMERIRRQEKFAAILDGSNRDDLADTRPGNRAKALYRVISPLQEAGLSKPEIRFLAKRQGLPNWDKPSLACLASRVPYGQPITPGRLRRIERAEEFLKTQGFGQVRVRDYGTLARLEVEPGDMERLLKRRKSVVAGMKKTGYTYVTMDMEGYRTGSMNLAKGAGSRSA